jgi:mRNA-degrading endonuclease RelE of RelBE toxin-antitoxin system
MEIFGFLETRDFTRKWLKLGLTDDDYFALQLRLMKNPEEGRVIPGTDGYRKLRIAIGSRGKRGGARVIYIIYRESQEILFEDVYSKNE